MCGEARHGVDLEEPQALVIEHEIHSRQVAAAQPVEGVHRDFGATVGDIARHVRVELVPRVVTKVLDSPVSATSFGFCKSHDAGATRDFSLTKNPSFFGRGVVVFVGFELLNND